jgi:hypothetical protein
MRGRRGRVFLSTSEDVPKRRGLAIDFLADDEEEAQQPQQRNQAGLRHGGQGVRQRRPTATTTDTARHPIDGLARFPRWGSSMALGSVGPCCRHGRHTRVFRGAKNVGASCHARFTKTRHSRINGTYCIASHVREFVKGIINHCIITSPLGHNLQKDGKTYLIQRPSASPGATPQQRFYKYNTNGIPFYVHF